MSGRDSNPDSCLGVFSRMTARWGGILVFLAERWTITLLPLLVPHLLKRRENERVSVLHDFLPFDSFIWSCFLGPSRGTRSSCYDANL
jgi:hypothetical protein